MCTCAQLPVILADALLWARARDSLSLEVIKQVWTLSRVSREGAQEVNPRRFQPVLVFSRSHPQLAREAHFLGPQTTLRLPQADKSPVTQKPGIRSQGEASG